MSTHTQLSRRHFLIALGASAAGIATVRCGGTSVEPVEVDCSGGPIIVIGAGIAGIAAARGLQDNGASVIIIEARDRIGGRIHTRDLAGVDIDLGASWIHGTRGNPLLDEMDRYGLDTLDYEADARFFDINGEEMDLDPLYRAVDGWYGELNRYRRRLGGDASVADSVEEFLAEYAEDEGWDETMQGYIRLVLELVAGYDYGGDLDTISLAEFNEEEWYGDNDVLPAGGYGRLVEAMAEGLDVRLSEPVESVTYGDDGVTVVTSAGPISGSAAIVTVPIGVLKTGAIMFDPPLPAEKAAAIDRIGVGSLEKIILRFAEPITSGRADALIAPRSSEEVFDVADFSEYYGEPTYFVFTQGTRSEWMVNATDEEVQTAVMDTLERVYGPLPEPLAMARSGWLTDPLANGCYSYIAVGSSFSDLDVVAAPVNNRVFFAGEGTNSGYLGTVHGAYQSGLREADRIRCV